MVVTICKAERCWYNADLPDLKMTVCSLSNKVHDGVVEKRIAMHCFDVNIINSTNIGRENAKKL